MIRYISTRGPGDPQSFTDVLLSGMAPDGGLYIPDSWPELDRDLLSHMAGLTYTDVAMQIIKPFVGDDIDAKVLRGLLADTYEGDAFDHTAVAPLAQLGPSAWLLELFHGPTLSFKDYALQFLGRLFDHVLEQKGERMTIVGATSGDTGSAAIDACKDSKNLDIFILHPQGRTSEVQRRQMTSVKADNVHNIAVAGTFDDCQALVKAMFADQKMRTDLNLSAVNSINWVRIMMQTVYYVTSALSLGAPDRPVSFTVPTGNFGNVYAAWVARHMGIPIHKLVVASNRNDILTRFFETGEMELEKVTPSLSPSMDIQVSSNFERYLCDSTGRDYKTLTQWMDDFKTKKRFAVDEALLEKTRSDFQAVRCTDNQTLDMIKACYEETGIMIDPHTAVGLYAAMQSMETDPAVPMVILACAHSAKFPDAVKQATGFAPPAPTRLSSVLYKAEHYTPLPNDLEKVKDFIKTKVRN